ncbi:hypothetical protein BC827DRAFT_1387381, partial [Russula dissimulans]
MRLGYPDIDIGPHPAEDVWISSAIHVSAMVVLYYDYILTLDREVQFLWPPHNKQGWFTMACLLNRYVPVLGYLPVVVSLFIKLDLPVCIGLHAYNEWFMMVVQLHAGILCSIRVYALYGQSRRIQVFLGFISLISLVTAGGAILFSRHAENGNDVIPVISSFVGCSHFLSSEKGRTSAIAWAGLSVFDTVIFSLTLYKAFTIGRGIRLLDVIVRDGTMYFLYDLFSLFTDKTPTIPNRVLSIMNFVNIFSLLFSPPLLRSFTTTLTNVLSAGLVSRLVLNLRERNSVLASLPTTVETELRFQAGLPVAQKSMTCIGNLPSCGCKRPWDLVGLVGMTFLLQIGPRSLYSVAHNWRKHGGGRPIRRKEAYDTLHESSFYCITHNEIILV